MYANELNNRKIEIIIPYTNAGGVASDGEPGEITAMRIINHGTMPAMHPKINGSHPP